MRGWVGGRGIAETCITILKTPPAAVCGKKRDVQFSVVCGDGFVLYVKPSVICLQAVLVGILDYVVSW